MLLFSRLRKRPAATAASARRSCRRASSAASMQPLEGHGRGPVPCVTTTAELLRPDSCTPKSFSYGAFVADAQARGRPLTRKERQAALAAQALAHHDSWTNKAASSIRTHLVNQQAIQMGSTSFAAGDRLSAVEKETYSYGRQASHGLAQRSQTERVSQVQKFLDSTRASTSASSVQASPTAVSTKLVDIQPKVKRGYTWSTLAGRSSFSYGQFVAQNPGTISAEMRRIAAQKFFDVSLPIESTSESEKDHR